jgi:hypothetical protein
LLISFGKETTPSGKDTLTRRMNARKGTNIRRTRNIMIDDNLPMYFILQSNNIITLIAL